MVHSSWIVRGRRNSTEEYQLRMIAKLYKKGDSPVAASVWDPITKNTLTHTSTGAEQREEDNINVIDIYHVLQSQTIFARRRNVLFCANEFANIALIKLQ